MVATQQLLDSLKQIGLNLYERKLWVALLSRGSSSAGELSSLAKVPHSRTYDVLESLAEKGFVLLQNTKPLKYAAITPIEALDRAKKKINEDAKVTVERISDFQSGGTVKELERLYKNGIELVEPNEITGSLRGRHMVSQQLETLIRGAKKKVSIVTSVEGLHELNHKHAEHLKKAASRGVRIRIAAPVGKEHAQAVSELKTFAEVKRLDKDNSGRFALIDDNHVVLALTDDKNTHPSQDLALWTQSEHAAAAVMAPMFESMWKTLPSA